VCWLFQAVFQENENKNGEDMKYHEASKQFKQALDNQQTISIPKLRNILETMNISHKGNNVLVTKRKGNVDTVIEYRGKRYVYDPGNK